MQFTSANVRTGPEGRPFAVELSLFLMILMPLCALIGTLFWISHMLFNGFAAWSSLSPVTGALIGAVMLGSVRGQYLCCQCAMWEQVRCLMFPLIVAVTALFVASAINTGELHFTRGGGLIAFLFSMGWLGVLGLLSMLAVVALLLQFRHPVAGAITSLHVLPPWSKPLLALLGAAWFGIGAGLLVLPQFWGEFIPWFTSSLDRQTLGALALALGTGLLGALAEDDLQRLRSALLALQWIALLCLITVGMLYRHVNWMSGPGVSLIALLGGLLLCAAVGHALLRVGKTPAADCQ